MVNFPPLITSLAKVDNLRKALMLYGVFVGVTFGVLLGVSFFVEVAVPFGMLEGVGVCIPFGVLVNVGVAVGEGVISRRCLAWARQSAGSTSFGNTKSDGSANRLCQ